MRYTKLTFIIQDRPPYFPGSQIRGAFGHALKKVVCINPSYKCEGCFAANDCIYYDFFEEKNGFHNYRLDFELGKEFYEISIYLFEDAATRFAYVISAIEKMLTQTGLGLKRKTYKDFELYLNDCTIRKNGSIEIGSISPVIEHRPKEFVKDMVLHFVTPLRIKKNNRFIRDESVELDDIIRSIQKRYKEITGDLLDIDKTQGRVTNKNIQYKELTRRSNRQNTTMNLGGVVGSVQIEGMDKKTFEVLSVGEIIGVGKQTVFGLGKIKIEVK